jgi:hypothetical protein
MPGGHVAHGNGSVLMRRAFLARRAERRAIGKRLTLYMEPRVERQTLIQALDAAQELLQETARSYPNLLPASRALRRVSRLLMRPLRLAVLGESNSGKSTIANLIAGEMALPALPVANTRLPSLLYYAPVPRVEALHESGDRSVLTFDHGFSPQSIVRLEVGLPSDMLRAVEILDFPGSANPLFQTDILAVLRHGIDAAIWTTVATQAWRETERFAWSGLPERIRRHGLLAVTHRDLIAGEDDLRKLRARLKTVAEEHFSAMCLVGAARAPEDDTADLFSELGQLRERIEAERLRKAVVTTQRVAADALDRLESYAGLS